MCEEKRKRTRRRGGGGGGARLAQPDYTCQNICGGLSTSFSLWDCEVRPDYRTSPKHMAHYADATSRMSAAKWQNLVSAATEMAPAPPLSSVGRRNHQPPVHRVRPESPKITQKSAFVIHPSETTALKPTAFSDADQLLPLPAHLRGLLMFSP